MVLLQFHVAFSARVHGVGVIAGGPYYCSLSNVLIAEGTCFYNAHAHTQMRYIFCVLWVHSKNEVCSLYVRGYENIMPLPFFPP